MDLGRRIIERFEGLSAPKVARLSKELAEESLKRGFTYQRGALIEPINLTLVPAFFTEEQIGYVSSVSLAIKRGLDAIYNAWFADPALSTLLPFEEAEAAWIKELFKGRCAKTRGGASRAQPLWYRLDAHFHMQRPEWRELVSIFEVNSSAVGGIHYAPSAESLFLDIVYPHISDASGLPAFKRSPDPRLLLLEIMRAHAKEIGRRTLNIVFCEDSSAEEGITELPSIVEFLKKKGLDHVYLADPRELYARDDEVRYKDAAIDVVYRNFELRDVIGMEEEGFDTRGIRLAFRKDLVISSASGDFDHKSMWEALGGGGFDKYFSQEDAAIFKKHLPWTRSLYERKASGPDGKVVDLVEYARAERENLVLKPNRLCGGYGVSIGAGMDQAQWDSLIEVALKDKEAWVVQSYASAEEGLFPHIEQGRLEVDAHNIVYGLTATPYGTVVLGRVSKKRVVNVAQQGGLMPVLRVVE